jgi:predicted nucleic acid-binding protein
MTALLDTGPLVAYLDPDDARHEQATRLLRRLLSGQLGLLLSTDTVYDEGMTLIRVRKKNRRLMESYHALFWPEANEPRPFEVLQTDLDQIKRAGAYQIQHFDQGLSLTDCTLILHAARRKAVIATFDGRFEGLAPTLTDHNG